MLDEVNFFWKNWRLGTELQVSGSFIYNGLYDLENMETFYYEEQCFELLYNLSVGLERLMKVAIVLLEHDNIKSKEDFEKTLITHNHFELFNRITKVKKINIGKTHNKFLSLLNKFYRSTRYERYNLDSIYKSPQEKTNLINFISEELNISAKFDERDLITPRIKKFLGNVVGKFTIQLYDIIRNEAFRLGTFTYEVTFGSKAFKIFIAKEFDFFKERLAQKEVLLYLLKAKKTKQFELFLTEVESLNFGEYHTNKYIERVFDISNDRLRIVMEEMESLYKEERPDKDRINFLGVFGTDINIEYNPNDDGI